MKASKTEKLSYHISIIKLSFVMLLFTDTEKLLMYLNHIATLPAFPLIWNTSKSFIFYQLESQINDLFWLKISLLISELNPELYFWSFVF